MVSVDQLLPVGAAPLADEKAKDPEKGMQALSVVGPPTDGQEAVSLMDRIEAVLPGNTRMKKWITVGLVMAIVLVASALGWKFYASKSKGHCPLGYVEAVSSSGASLDRRLMEENKEDKSNEHQNCIQVLISSTQSLEASKPSDHKNMMPGQDLENIQSTRKGLTDKMVLQDLENIQSRKNLQDKMGSTTSRRHPLYGKDAQQIKWGNASLRRSIKYHGMVQDLVRQIDSENIRMRQSAQARVGAPGGRQRLWNLPAAANQVVNQEAWPAADLNDTMASSTFANSAQEQNSP